MQEQLEKMNQYLNQIMVVSRIQSQIHDIYIKPVSLKDSVYQSIKNNQFFLINKHFEMDVNVENLQIYSDKTWLIYVLDQIINNAIKYAKDLLHQLLEQEKAPKDTEPSSDEDSDFDENQETNEQA